MKDSLRGFSADPKAFKRDYDINNYNLFIQFLKDSLQQIKFLEVIIEMFKEFCNDPKNGNTTMFSPRLFPEPNKNHNLYKKSVDTINSLKLNYKIFLESSSLNFKIQEKGFYLKNYKTKSQYDEIKSKYKNEIKKSSELQNKISELQKHIENIRINFYKDQSTRQEASNRFNIYKVDSNYIFDVKYFSPTSTLSESCVKIMNERLTEVKLFYEGKITELLKRIKKLENDLSLKELALQNALKDNFENFRTIFEKLKLSSKSPKILWNILLEIIDNDLMKKYIVKLIGKNNYKELNDQYTKIQKHIQMQIDLIQNLIYSTKKIHVDQYTDTSDLNSMQIDFDYSLNQCKSFESRKAVQSPNKSKFSFKFGDIDRSHKDKDPSFYTKKKTSLKNLPVSTSRELLELSSMVKKQKTEIEMISLLNKSLSQEIVKQTTPQSEVKKSILFKLSEILKVDSIFKFQDKVSPLISQPFISYKEDSTTFNHKEFNNYLKTKKFIKDEKIDTTEFENEYLNIEGNFVPRFDININKDRIGRYNFGKGRHSKNLQKKNSNSQNDLNLDNSKSSHSMPINQNKNKKLFKTHFFDMNVENSNIDFFKKEKQNNNTKISLIGKINQKIKNFDQIFKVKMHSPSKEFTHHLGNEKSPIDSKLQDALLEGNYTKVSRLNKQFNHEEYLLNTGNEVESENKNNKWNLIHNLFDNTIDNTINYYKKSLQKSNGKHKKSDSNKVCLNHKSNKSSLNQNLNRFSNIELFKAMTKSQHPFPKFTNQTSHSEYLNHSFGNRSHSFCLDQESKVEPIKY